MLQFLRGVLQSRHNNRQNQLYLLALLVYFGYKHRLWLRVQAEVWAIQLKALTSEGSTDGGVLNWLRFQYHVWKLLELDTVRRLEEGTVGKLSLSPGVPHVDTGGGVVTTFATPSTAASSVVSAGGAAGGAGAGAAAPVVAKPAAAKVGGDRLPVCVAAHHADAAPLVPCGEALHGCCVCV